MVSICFIGIPNNAYLWNERHVYDAVESIRACLSQSPTNPE